MAGNRVVVQEGYELPFSDFDGHSKRRTRRSSGGKRGQRSRFAAAARACKGQSIRLFRACMKRKLKGY
jgi:hypothetical protein